MMYILKPLFVIFSLYTLIFPGCASYRDTPIDQLVSYDNIVTINDAKHFLQTPEMTAEFMDQYFTFFSYGNRTEMLGSNRTFTAREMIWRRKGDCKDYALFSAYIMNNLGYDVRVAHYFHTYKGDSRGVSGHVITIFTTDHQEYYFFTNAHLQGPFSSEQECIKFDFETTWHINKGMYDELLLMYKTTDYNNTSIIPEKNKASDEIVILEPDLWQQIVSTKKWW
jgi:hypothetical protein